jgi:lysyl-tRNA synthetase class 2
MSEPVSPPDAPASDATREEEILAVRAHKAEELRKRGINPFGNGHMPPDDCGTLIALHKDDDAAKLESLGAKYGIAGRVMAVRTMGKLVFAKLRDRSGELQAMLRKNVIGDDAWDVLTKLTDIGDFVAISGKCIRTKTGELSIDVEKFTFLTKSLRPLPEKWHGIADVEMRYRQRYLDLVSTYPSVQEIFRMRSKVVRGVQTFLDARDFIEVETPMLHKPEEAGGAAARPFSTHHNALNLDLKLRIATELHLKRLVVGGFERVYEIGRIFRNEGIDRRHNPEFTTVEFYWAYATYEDLITLTEELMVSLATHLLGKAELAYQEQTISLQRPFPRVSMVQSVAEQVKARFGLDVGDVNAMYGTHAEALRQKAQELCGRPVESVGEAIAVLFEHLVEETLPKDRPSFVVDFPIEISPLARRRDSEPRLTDRFELYVAGMEIANAFSELNDPVDQRQRFEKQLERKAQGDAEAMPFDEDFIRALEHGMPPTAGQGIGIDRLVMLFTNQPNIREVVLFPLLKPLG